MIRVGIGGWTFPPWRGVFYPAGLPHAQELAYAAGRLTSIEINATFHGTQKPESFRKWRDAVPEGFVFSVKAPRYATWRRELAEARPSIARFLDSGVTELGPKLGPMLWQLPPTRKFDAAAIEPFLALLPREHAGLALRHAVETPHESFADPAWRALLRQYGVAWAMIDAEGYPTAEPTADFVYARLKRNAQAEPQGYASAALDSWRKQLGRWSAAGLDCFVYFIAGDKVRAPAAAAAMLRQLDTAPE
jgi:uncharacterized protein YecE (DUF72 family)